MKKILGRSAALLIVLLAAIVVMRILFPLPDISERQDSSAIAATPETQLGIRVAAEGENDGGRSGVLSLSCGQDALASRLALIDAAEQSVDAQYYIWHDDISGILLLDAL